MPERKVSFIDALAYGTASKREREKMDENYMRKTYGHSSSSKKSKNHDDGRSAASASGPPADQGPEDAPGERPYSQDWVLTDDVEQRSQADSILDLYDYDRDEPSRDTRSPLHSAGLDVTRPSTAPNRSHRSPSRSSKPKKKGPMSALKTFGHQIFGKPSKSEKKKNSHKMPGKWFNTPSASARPSTAAEADEHRGAPIWPEANMEARRIQEWIDNVDQDDPGASGVVLSDEGDDTPSGYNMSNFPMRSEYGGHQADSSSGDGIDARDLVPGDSVTSILRRR